jgi:signal transduction histidine kinase
MHDSTTLKDLDEAALLGQLARPVAHECNNFLNTLLLQIALIERELPESHRKEFAGIRDEGRRLAHVIQEWQNFTAKPSDGPPATSLQATLRDLVEVLQPKAQAGKAKISLALDPKADLVTGSRLDVKTLLYLLLSQALAYRDQGEITVTTVPKAERIVFELSAGGPDWAAIFEGRSGQTDGVTRLATLTSKSLTQRLRAPFTVKKTTDAASVIVEFEPAQETRR